MSQCIVSVGVDPPGGGWYAMGLTCLKGSLLRNKWGAGRMMLFDQYPNGCPPHQEVPYGFKLAAIKAARDAGHDQVLWLDTSAWAVANPWPVFERIKADGHYFWDGGYKCNEWCNDRSLAYFGITREQARDIKMLYAIVIGLDFRNKRTRQFFSRWEKSLEDGIFNGSWKREPGDQEAPEYLGHRHDQSCASLIAHQLGMGLDPTDDLCRLYEQKMPETVVLTFQGL